MEQNALMRTLFDTDFVKGRTKVNEGWLEQHKDLARKRHTLYKRADGRFVVVAQVAENKKVEYKLPTFITSKEQGMALLSLL